MHVVWSNSMQQQEEEQVRALKRCGAGRIQQERLNEQLYQEDHRTSAASSPSSIPAGSSGIITAAATTTTTCELIGKGSDGTQSCASGSGSTTCEMGPSACPGMSDAPAAAQQQQLLQGGEASSSRRVTMTDATVAALVDAETVGPPATAAYDLKGEATLAALGRLDDAGYFNSGM